jgi:hypothetical protein
MKSFRRIFTVFACTLVLAGTAVSPATAHDREFTHPTPDGFIRNVTCPHPYLITPFGPLSVCTSGTTGVVEPRDVGYYSPVRNDFVDLYRNLNTWDSSPPVARTVVATDGVKGTFRGGFLVSTAFGPASYGIQYIIYLTKPIGRFGNYSPVTGRFHPDPNQPWYPAEHAI